MGIRLLDMVACTLPFTHMGEQKKGRVVYINRENKWFLVEFEGKIGTYRIAYKMNGSGWNNGELMPAGRSPKYAG